MRSSLVFRLITLTVPVVAGVLWYRERAITAELENQLAALHQQERKLSGLQADRDYLRKQLGAAVTDTGVAPNVTAPPEARPADQPASAVTLSLGAWTPVTAWKNEGRATPLATMATFLWAAAGGDQAALQSALMLDDATRAKALAWFNALPPATRSLYATPEDLVAGVTMKNIPLTAAQLSWFHQTDAERAIVGVHLSVPQSSVDKSDSVLESPAPGAPPRLANSNPNPLAVLTLRLSADGWRVVVPAAAIDQMAAELRTPPAD